LAELPVRHPTSKALAEIDDLEAKLRKAHENTGVVERLATFDQKYRFFRIGI
jgi:hypothetical protein